MCKNNRIKAVFFDAGNTLLRPFPSVEHVCNEVFQRSGHIVDPHLLQSAIVMGDTYYETCYWKDDRFWCSDSEAEAMWVELYALVAAHIGINGKRYQLAKEIYDEFGFGHRWQLFPDVEPLLDELKERDVSVGVISNWDGRLPQIFNEMEIAHHFDFVISSANVGKLKPQPEIFEMALSRAQVNPEECIHVGDHYYADIMGARTCGITPILIDRSTGQDHTQNSFDCNVISNLLSVLDLL